MYEVETQFGINNMSLKEKIQKFAQLHGVSEKTIWNMYESTSDTQMSELRKWQYINSQIYKMKGDI